MPAPPRKVCVLGRGGAGKTTLALRMAGRDDAAVPRARWRVLPVEVTLEGGGAQSLRLFDGPGTQLLDSLSQPMLLGAAAWLLVADGTDPASVAALPMLHAAARSAIGARPALVLLNKADLAAAGTRDQQRLAALGPVHALSARTGEGVAAAVAALGRLLRE